MYIFIKRKTSKLFYSTPPMTFFFLSFFLSFLLIFFRNLPLSCCNYKTSTARWWHCSASMHLPPNRKSHKLDVLRTSYTLSHEGTPGSVSIAWFLTPHSLSNCYYTADGMRFICLIPFTTKNHGAMIVQRGRGGVCGRGNQWAQ